MNERVEDENWRFDEVKTFLEIFIGESLLVKISLFVIMFLIMFLGNILSISGIGVLLSYCRVGEAQQP